MVWSGLVLGLLLCAGIVFEVIGSALEARKYPPPGRLVDVGGLRLHVNCLGEGSPVVVMDSGVGSFSLDWSLVLPEIARFTRACVYDRAGMGWSGPGRGPRTSRRIAAELHALASKAGLEPPFVLVGHSSGGLNVRLYAATYPRDVVGVVLVDSSSPERILRIPEEVRAAEARDAKSKARLYAMLVRLGALRLYKTFRAQERVFDDFGSSYLRKLPPEIQTAYLAVCMSTKYFQTTAEEESSLPESAQQVNAAGTLGSIPLIVLSRQRAAGDQGMESQRSLLRLSTYSQQVVVDAGHFIQIEAPEVVVTAIRRVIEKAPLQMQANVNR